jgi:RND family efflux transporter MFP subunit
MPNRKSGLVCLLLILGLSACSGPAEESSRDAARWVQTATVESAGAARVGLSGTVRARFETPLSFQVGGRILERRVDAGQHVESGEVIIRLDPRDLEQAVQVARADLDTAIAELATAEAETRRSRDLLEREFISDQAFERVDLAEKAGRERVDAARARLEQASNALEYGSLSVDRSGTLVDVIAEPGQVVPAGQTVAVIADDGPMEVEVFLPETLGVPERASLEISGSGPIPLDLREVAGAADPETRTWAARYRLADAVPTLRLGSVVRVVLSRDLPASVLRVPIGAINERGEGAQVWRIVEGRARPLPVNLVDLDSEHAQIIADLEPGDEVIALGTHLLQDGMPVRSLGSR